MYVFWAFYNEVLLLAPCSMHLPPCPLYVAFCSLQFSNQTTSFVLINHVCFSSGDPFHSFYKEICHLDLCTLHLATCTLPHCPLTLAVFESNKFMCSNQTYLIAEKVNSGRGTGALCHIYILRASPCAAGAYM